MRHSSSEGGRLGGQAFVSVVVPVFDSRTGIRDTLRALLRQSYPDDLYEVLVVDNGSTDGTREVVEQFAKEHPGRIRLLTEFDKRSSYAARNVGINAACGSILAFTDADCLPEPEWLTEGVRSLESQSAGYVAGRIQMTFRGPRPNIWEYYDAVGKLNQRRYMERGFGATANLFVRRHCVEVHGSFRGDLVSGGDYEFGRRLAKAGERGAYADSAVVRHAARRTLGAILRKERRILHGRRQLEALGLLEHGLLSWRSFVPVRRCPPLTDAAPGLLRRLTFVIVANFVRYYTLVLRVARLRQPVLGEVDNDR